VCPAGGRNPSEPVVEFRLCERFRTLTLVDHLNVCPGMRTARKQRESWSHG